MVHHILIIAFPTHGHINPALQFAKRLIDLGAHVTFSTTLQMHRCITLTVPGLNYAPISDADFKANHESDFLLFLTELKLHGSEFISNIVLSNAKEGGHPFTCIVYTLIISWVAEVARGLHLPSALLWVQAATVFDIFYYQSHGYSDYIYDKTKDKEFSSSSSIELPGLPLLLAPNDLPSYLVASTSSTNFSAVFIPLFEEHFRVLDNETNPIVLVNTFEALEQEALRAVDKINVISVGPLIPADTSYGGDISKSSDDYIEWLDSKPESSVVYVSFGSFLMLSKIQLEEIARGLLDSGHPFLWVIIREKGKKGEEEKEKEEELSCIEELKKSGKIVEWCSQVEVLSHPSFGCFLTHCGWNSTLECLVSGVPVVAFPQQVDQKTNAKLIEDLWKIGVRVDHVVNDELIVKGEEIKKGLDIVMGNGEKGEELRRNAKKWKGLAKEAVKEGGSSDKNLTSFLDDIVG
ncbi:hypothetical protein TanjilG_18161 [Lupinus angustifolius]|uniref:Glycosyltransferase n=1 Tax=Lupinus angustifolius TaxID=3871 RepID=A0A394DGT1_LUPAN|nr:PREDICTED: crocetin glucosyltransferase, chloroplastic-like [Lupinus angustifolius]OIW21963.1 hypothetical protein TanjilG_18161 [Lupinus angustifolius]UYR41668.1 anthocyanidin 3-O-glucoside 5-O-glucosyltransferase [synthetic construct]